MFKETDGDSFEEMRSLNQELTFKVATREFEKRGLQLEEPQMRTLGMINGESIYTNLALLLSDQCPHIIKCASFKGKEEEEFQDRKEFSGSLLKQLNEAYSYLDMRNQIHASFEGLYRIDTRDYPEAAIREALLNAIVHRDYGFSASTLISVYENRIEFVSFGGIPADATLDDIMLGISVPRNHKLAEIFYRLKLIEAYGTGIKKIRLSYRDHSVQPKFETASKSFKVTLPSMNGDDYDTEELSESEERILFYLKTVEKASRVDIEKATGIKGSTAIRVINQLKTKSKVRVEGKGKNTKYKIS